MPVDASRSPRASSPDQLDSTEFDSGLLDLEHEEKPAKKAPGHPVEMVLALLANAVWGVVGLVLWVPLLARTLLLSVTGLIHGGLTGQKPSKTTQRIRRASRFYTDPFLRRSQFDSASAGARQGLRGTLLLGEIVWAALFYAALAWALGFISFSPQEAIKPALGWLSSLGSSALVLIQDLWSRAPGEIKALGGLGPAVWIVLGLLVVLAHLAGWWLARRRH